MCLAAAVASGQDRASLAGQIVDAKKDGVPQVAVKVAGPGAAREAQTDASGMFIFDNLPVGSYTLEASKPGFAPVRFQLNLGMRERRFLRVQLGADGAPAKAAELSGASPSVDLSVGVWFPIAGAGHLPLSSRDLPSLALLAPVASNATPAADRSPSPWPSTRR